MENNQFLDKYSVKVLNERAGHQYRYDRFFNVATDADAVVPPFYKYQYEQVFTQADYERIMIVQIPESSLSRLEHLDRLFSSHVTSAASERAMTILDRNHQAKAIREANPAVKAAWEQYSLLLHLASNGQELP